MDLNRLKIPEDEGHRPTGKPRYIWLVIILALAAGYALGSFAPLKRNGGFKVTTGVVTSRTSGDTASFTAGGWIEVAVPRYPIVVSSKIMEVVDEVLVVQGQTVEPGQVLVRLNDTDIRHELALARAQESTATQELALMEAGYRTEDIAASEADVQHCESALKQTEAKVGEVEESVKSAQAMLDEAIEKERIALANFERGKTLVPVSMTEQELDNLESSWRQASSARKRAEAGLASSRAALVTAKAEIEKSVANLAIARANFAKLKAGYRVEEIEMARAKLAEFKAKVALIERRLSYCTVTAPQHPRPLRVLNVKIHAGTYIDTRDDSDMLSLYDPQEIQVRADVTQANISSVREGGEVLVSTDANPSHQYRGRVVRIEPLAVLSKNTITVKIAIDEPDSRLFPEMVARITFLAPKVAAGGNEPDGIFVPTAAIVADGGASLVFVVRDGAVQKRSITTAGTQGPLTRVSQGLASGDIVVLSPPPGLVDGSKIKE
jgi:RND family efflux transporter MFP subunit